MTHAYLIEGLPECELYHSHVKTVKHLFAVCANPGSLKLRFFDGSNPNTLNQILGKKKLNLNPVEFLKESNIYNLEFETSDP